MKFVMFVCGDPDFTEADEQAAPSQEAWFDAAAGVYELGVRCEEPSTAATVRVRNGELVVTDGPFNRGPEWIAGLAILDAPDLETAVGLAAINPMAYTGRMEIRPIHSMGGPDG